MLQWYHRESLLQKLFHGFLLDLTSQIDLPIEINKCLSWPKAKQFELGLTTTPQQMLAQKPKIPGAFQLVPAFGNVDAFLPTRAQFQLPNLWCTHGRAAQHRAAWAHDWTNGSGPLDMKLMRIWLTIRYWNCSCHPPHDNLLLWNLLQFDYCNMMA